MIKHSNKQAQNKTPSFENIKQKETTQQSNYDNRGKRDPDD